MDALMAALVLGALTQAGDRTPWLAAILADRYRAPGTVILAAALALGLNYAVGAAVGIAITRLLIPEARLLLLALALLLAGFGTGWRTKRPDPLAGWRLGAFGTSLAGLAIMAFGDRMQFVAAALAGRSALPQTAAMGAAAVGATAGALAVTAAAVAMGEAGWRRLPHRAIALGSAALLVVAGLWTGLAGLRLV